MSAIDTAQRVIDWAAVSGPGSTLSPPQGDVRLAEQLAHPPVMLADALARLAALTIARLRFGSPPLGDARPLGVGPLITAAAIGIAYSLQLPQLVLQAAPMGDSAVDWVATHGLVAPALRFLPEDVSDACRRASPLTSLLDRPAVGGEALAVGTAFRLISHADERTSLTVQLAAPTADARIRTWRTELLERMRLEDQAFVLDVYEATLIHHARRAIEQVRAAKATLLDPLAVHDEIGLRDAMAVADWWRPLWVIERADLDALRARRYLDYAFREGVALFQLSRRLRGELI